MTQVVDEARLGEFMGQMVGYMTGGAMCFGVWLGDELGLYRALTEIGPATADEVAGKASCNARLTREWLDGQVTGGLIAWDPSIDSYELAPEAVLALADDESPAFVARGMNAFASMFIDMPKIANGSGSRRTSPTAPTARNTSHSCRSRSTPSATSSSTNCPTRPSMISCSCIAGGKRAERQPSGIPIQLSGRGVLRDQVVRQRGHGGRDLDRELTSAQSCEQHFRQGPTVESPPRSQYPDKAAGNPTAPSAERSREPNLRSVVTVYRYE